jgi:hypothetical protein
MMSDDAVPPLSLPAVVLTLVLPVVHVLVPTNQSAVHISLGEHLCLNHSHDDSLITDSSSDDPHTVPASIPGVLGIRRKPVGAPSRSSGTSTMY